MPKIDGVEVLKEIRAEKSLETIPVVVLTSSDKKTDVAKAYEEHVNSYLVKPVDFAQYDQLMEQVGYYWLAWNHYPLKNPDE